MKKKFIIISYVVCAFIIVVLGVLLYQAYRTEDTLLSSSATQFDEDGFYTNPEGTKISMFDFHILELFLDKSEINYLNNEHVEGYVNWYFTDLEAYNMYGYIGSYTETETKVGNNNEIIVVKLTSKTLPFTSSEYEMDEDEYFCTLGTTASGIFIESEYKDGKCAFEKEMCDLLLVEGADSYITWSEYCE